MLIIITFVMVMALAFVNEFITNSAIVTDVVKLLDTSRLAGMVTYLVCYPEDLAVADHYEMIPEDVILLPIKESIHRFEYSHRDIKESHGSSKKKHARYYRKDNYKSVRVNKPFCPIELY